MGGADGTKNCTSNDWDYMELDSETLEALGWGSVPDTFEIAVRMEERRRGFQLFTGVYRKRNQPKPKPARAAQCRCCGRGIEQTSKRPKLYCSHACGSRKRYVRRSPNALRARKAAERAAQNINTPAAFRDTLLHLARWSR